MVRLNQTDGNQSSRTFTSRNWNDGSLDSVGRLQTTRLCYPLFPQRSKMSKLKNLAIKVIFLGWWFVLCPPAPCWRETLKKGSFLANVSVHQIRPTQRAFTSSTTFPLSVSKLPTSAVGFGWHGLFDSDCQELVLTITRI